MRLASLLLRTVSPRYAAVVLADLQESVPAHRFWPELLKSLLPLLTAEVRRSNYRSSALLLLVLSSFAAPLLLDAGWSSILSQIPLKDGLIRNTDFLLFHLIFTAPLALLTGAFSTLRAQLFTVPAAALFTFAALSFTCGKIPAAFPLILILTTAIFMLLGSYKFRRQTI